MGFKKLAVTALGLVLGLAIGTGAMAQEMMKYEVKDGVSIVKSLTGKKGDAKKGRETAIHRKKGNCLACHVLPIPEQPFHGKIGPDLNGVASRYTAGEIRLRIVDPKIINEDTIMPAFYKKEGLHRVLKKFVGKTLVSAQDVEDMVAYLMTLK